LRVTSEKYVPFESRIQISPEKEKKVYIKMDPAESKIIKNPGYAYGTKLGIQLKVMEEDESLVSAGLLVYLPYARLSGSFSFISLYYLWGEGYKFSIPWKVETLKNIPLDWLCIQFGISYSVYSYAHLTTSQYPPYARIVQENNFSSLGFPVGVEFFINSHLSLDFHIGPAFQFYQHYYNGNLDADKCNFMGAGNLVGMNYYF